MKAEYVVVGSGLTGATIARLLYDNGRDVMVVERRPHLGGNVHSFNHESGIPIHTYGPHCFRTGNESIWKFVQRFAEFYKYEHRVVSLVDGKFEQWPICSEYLERKFASSGFYEYVDDPANFEEACLKMMPRGIYERFVKGYTEKQWGVPATTLSPSLATRFEIRMNDDPRLSILPYQGLPLCGWATFMENMLDGIPVVLNFDYLEAPEVIRPRRKLIFTGPIDEFFDFRLGKLKYRGQRRSRNYADGIGNTLPAPQVNDPIEGDRQIRTIEWKQLLPAMYAESIRGSVVTSEIPYTPTDPDDYEYPFPDAENAALYAKYRKEADEVEHVMVCGRLGEYAYLDMDQAIARAMALSHQLLKEDQP
jgi:UDP-galactopyranose mutase